MKSIDKSIFSKNLYKISIFNTFFYANFSPEAKVFLYLKVIPKKKFLFIFFNGFSAILI
jgi:hypothetical protein